MNLITFGGVCSLYDPRSLQFVEARTQPVLINVVCVLGNDVYFLVVRLTPFYVCALRF